MNDELVVVASGPSCRRWRPRFSVRGLFALTLIVALIAGLLVQHRQLRQLRQANEILASHGLAWDQPLAADEVRINVTLKQLDDYNSFRILVVRIQTSSSGTIQSTGADPTPPQELLPVGNGMYTGEYFIFSEFVGNTLSRYNRVSGAGSVNMGPWQGRRGPGAIVDEVDPVVIPGIYKRGAEIPIFKRQGEMVFLIVN